MAFHTVRDDKVAFKESGVDVKSKREEIEDAKKWLNRLKEDSSYTPEKITKIQELLMNLTMPIWQGRTSEFRERKLKRGLFIHG